MGDTEHDSLMGDKEHDSLMGDTEHDSLMGDTEHDSLMGDSEHDSLMGDTEHDSLMADTEHEEPLHLPLESRRTWGPTSSTRGTPDRSPPVPPGHAPAGVRPPPRGASAPPAEPQARPDPPPPPRSTSPGSTAIRDPNQGLCGRDPLCPGHPNTGLRRRDLGAAPSRAQHCGGPGGPASTPSRSPPHTVPGGAHGSAPPPGQVVPGRPEAHGGRQGMQAPAPGRERELEPELTTEAESEGPTSSTRGTPDRSPPVPPGHAPAGVRPPPRGASAPPAEPQARPDPPPPPRSTSPGSTAIRDPNQGLCGRDPLCPGHPNTGLRRRDLGAAPSRAQHCGGPGGPASTPSRSPPHTVPGGAHGSAPPPGQVVPGRPEAHGGRQGMQAPAPGRERELEPELTTEAESDVAGTTPGQRWPRTAEASRAAVAGEELAPRPSPGAPGTPGPARCTRTPAAPQPPPLPATLEDPAPEPQPRGAPTPRPFPARSASAEPPLPGAFHLLPRPGPGSLCDFAAAAGTAQPHLLRRGREARQAATTPALPSGPFPPAAPTPSSGGFPAAAAAARTCPRPERARGLPWGRPGSGVSLLRPQDREGSRRGPASGMSPPRAAGARAGRPGSGHYTSVKQNVRG
ncbi:basic proline-rich protein-like [Enhydra lutris kenyoni]|uniref:Basic proline-rich protein-like n=1 Tax=Enhydra lutris kenyoni TaxID=391180 RepID=A0A2Y9K6T9_ENHLU|nr:basic proline-rich protein-like [Enhydra lutris kenyoni]